jgi:hypothetical protein
MFRDFFSFVRLQFKTLRFFTVPYDRYLKRRKLALEILEQNPDSYFRPLIEMTLLSGYLKDANIMAADERLKLSYYYYPTEVLNTLPDIQSCYQHHGVERSISEFKDLLNDCKHRRTKI